MSDAAVTPTEAAPAVEVTPTEVAPAAVVETPALETPAEAAPAADASSSDTSPADETDETATEEAAEPTTLHSKAFILGAGDYTEYDHDANIGATKQYATAAGLVVVGEPRFVSDELFEDGTSHVLTYEFDAADETEPRAL
jgi:hypothetical protein